MKRFFFALLVWVLVSCNAAPAQSTLRVEAAWARPAQAGENSAIYFTINNSGSADTLLSAQTDIAEKVELHMSMMQHDAMQMQMQHEIAIPKGTTEFKPGGYHVMLIGLRRDLKIGDTFSLTLTFKRAGELTLTVTVKE